MKRLFLLFHGRFPSEKAASLFAAKSCEAFADIGFQVVLIVPRRKKVEESDPYAYYGIKNNFTVVRVPTIDLFGLPLLSRIAFQVSFLIFSISCFCFLLFHARKRDIVYSNESLSILLASLYFPFTLYEVHDFPERKKPFYSLIFSRVRFILATNTWKSNQLSRFMGVPQKKILVERNAVDIGDFDVTLTKDDARKKFSLPADRRIVLYTGHLYAWKGVDGLARAAQYFTEDILVIFVGGTHEDIERFRHLYGNIKNIRIIGHRPHAEIPYWQKAADVLVLPNTATEHISKYQTSPMKLFEYMASGRPIVATDIPSVREILNPSNAAIVPADDERSLAEAIQMLLARTDYATKIAHNAYVQITHHTWLERAKRIADFMNKDAGQ